MTCFVVCVNYVVFVVVSCMIFSVSCLVVVWFSNNYHVCMTTVPHFGPIKIGR